MQNWNFLCVPKNRYKPMWYFKAKKVAPARVWVLEQLLSYSSWNRSSLCRFGFDCLAEDTFCHNKLSLSYLKSFTCMNSLMACIFSGIFPQRCVSESHWGLCRLVLLFECVCMCVGVLPVPSVDPRPRLREKQHEKRK